MFFLFHESYHHQLIPQRLSYCWFRCNFRVPVPVCRYRKHSWNINHSNFDVCFNFPVSLFLLIILPLLSQIFSNSEICPFLYYCNTPVRNKSHLLIQFVPVFPICFQTYTSVSGTSRQWWWRPQVVPMFTRVGQVATPTNQLPFQTIASAGAFKWNSTWTVELWDWWWLWCALRGWCPGLMANPGVPTLRSISCLTEGECEEFEVSDTTIYVPTE